MDVLMVPKADTWGKSINAPSSWNPRFRQAGTPEPPSAVVSGWERQPSPQSPGPNRDPCRPWSVNSRPAGLGLLCQNRSEPNGLACLLAGRCCECPFTGRFVPVKRPVVPDQLLGCESPGSREGEVKPQEKMSVPIEVWYREQGERLPVTCSELCHHCLSSLIWGGRQGGVCEANGPGQLVSCTLAVRCGPCPRLHLTAKSDGTQVLCARHCTRLWGLQWRTRVTQALVQGAHALEQVMAILRDECFTAEGWGATGAMGRGQRNASS